MKFEYVDYNKNISNNLLIDDVKKVANKLNSKSLSIKEYDLYGSYDSSTIICRFYS